MLLCNVSWMKRYEGVTRDDVPRHGGKYVNEHGFGHEAINVKPHNGKVYGFVQVNTIDIGRLDRRATDKVEGVLVLWRARSTRGAVIVGWFKNATVFRKRQPAIKGRQFQHDGETIKPEWIIEANEKDATLVPADERFFSVPVSHKGFGSQTFVSFLNRDDLKEVTAFKEKLLLYISQVENGLKPTPLAEEVKTPARFFEGATQEISVNAYERNPFARRQCIEHYGCRCAVCGFDFEKVFGQRGQGFIHVHHLKPLSTIKRIYEIDPIKDLCPICPNCHAMIHQDPTMSVEALRDILAR